MFDLYECSYFLGSMFYGIYTLFFFFNSSESSNIVAKHVIKWILYKITYAKVHIILGMADVGDNE